MSPRGRPRRADVYARFEAAATDLTRLGGLPSPVEAAGIWDDIWHLEAHNSTAIEGNTLILREVEVLLDTGRAVGAKELRDYLEVAGYGQAAKWVYTQALTADGWQSGDLITVTEIRHIHTVAMGPVWEVSPHPDADPSETPGSFRRHDIHPFGGGMTPPAWTDVPSHLESWVRDVDHARVCRGDPTRPGAGAAAHPGPVALPVRTDPPVHRRQRPGRAAHVEPHPGPVGVAAGDHLQTGQGPVPHRPGPRRSRRLRSPRRTDRPIRAGKPSTPRRAQHRRAGPPGTPAIPRRPTTSATPRSGKQPPADG